MNNSNVDKALLGKKLRELRESRNFKTEAELSKAAGVHLPQIKSWEKGISFPKLDGLQKYLRACQKTLVSFFQDLEAMDPKTTVHIPVKRLNKDRHEQLEYLLNCRDDVTQRLISKFLSAFFRDYQESERKKGKE